MKSPPLRWLPGLAVLLASVLPATPAHATFTDITAGLPGVSAVAMAWGDYDGDGDLDLAICGSSLGSRIARVYRNTGGAFADALALPVSAGVSNGSLAWGDYDNDGDLDLGLAGYTGTSVATRIYRNDGGTFTDIGASLEGIRAGTVRWVDFDNDGDLDLAEVGSPTLGVGVAHLYRNSGGQFAEAFPGPTGVPSAAMAWGDYDNDGDADVVIAGGTGMSASTSLYRNDAGTLSSVASGLPGVIEGGVPWADYDNDGDLDLFIGGYTGTMVLASLYRNTGGNFANAGVPLQGISSAVVGWGDYDNDGQPDLALGGNTGSGPVFAVYRNQAGTFTDIGATLPLLSSGALAWGDYDNDGDLDLALAGLISTGAITRIYRNDGVSADHLPAAPTGQYATVDSARVTFHWDRSSDAEGGDLGLSYNLWAGSRPDTADVMPAMADLATGYRRVSQLGNVSENQQWSVARSAFTGSIYWGVQAVDQAFAGGPFAAGPAFVLGVDDRRAPAGPSLRLAGANPVRAVARILYSLPRDSRVQLAVYDVTGRLVERLVDGERPAGEGETRWAGARAGATGPGLYFVRLTAAGASASLKLLRFE
jgi:hypothetical protein